MKRVWLILLVACLLFAAGARDAFDDWVDRTALPALLADTSVEVVDRDGQLLRAYTVDSGIWRMGARLDEVDQHYISMLVAYEDQRFWQHKGVDLWAFGRAVLQAASQGKIVSGGSTLTMQVARLLEDSGTGAWRGKWRQIRLALALERRLEKAEILQLYLTHAPFGGNLEGIRAATLAWFGKEPKRLTPAQTALLVALPQSPNARRPDRFPSAATEARRRVLLRAEAEGVLTSEAVEAAEMTPVPNARRDFPALSAHLADRAVAERPSATSHQLTLSYEKQKSLEALAARALRPL